MEEQKKEGHKQEHHSSHHTEHHKLHNSNWNSRVSGNWNIIILAIALILVVVVAVNVATSFSISKGLKEKAAAAEDAARPAEIEMIVVTNSECPNCFDSSLLTEFVRSSNVNVKNEKTIEFDSAEAKELTAKYGIQIVPALVVTGEIDKASLEGFEKRDDALVFTKISPPYTDVSDGSVKGLVAVYLLKDDSCEKCNDLSSLIGQITFSGIKITEQRNISAGSPEGAAFAQKYNINFIPSMILSKEAGVYELIQQAWGQIGSKEADGSYVLRTPYPPFINLTTLETKGLVDVTYLADDSCSDCYDVKTHKEILTSPNSFALIFNSEETVDISGAKGKELIAKYNITMAPAVILSKAAGDYPSSEGLTQFFSVESDGTYVFRQPAVLGNYKDLITNEVVRPQQQ
jgi:hypothetical protein